MSLAVVGADHPNRRGPGRRFELRLCSPGEPIELRPEPKNPADPRAIAVYSSRGVQLGYLTAERCGWIGGMLAEGVEIVAVFQARASFGAWIRISFDGTTPTIPAASAERVEREASFGDDEFWPDPIWPDD